MKIKARKATSLDKICRVDISLSSPISNDANFDNILLLGPLPKAPTKEIATLGAYSSLEELTDLGVTTLGDDADPVGVAARVAFSQSPRPHTVYVCFIDKVPSAEAPEVLVDQTISDALTDAVGMNGWYCVCPVALSKDQVAEAIQWTETHNKLCGYVDPNPEDPIVEPGVYMRSYAYYPKVTVDQPLEEIPLENRYGGAAAMAVKAMHWHAGEETWALKALAAVYPSSLSTTDMSTLDDNNYSYVITIASKNLTQGGRTSGGEWIDVIRFRDWLQNDMQVRVVNLLVVNPKIPYTDNGIALVENQMLASLADGQRHNGICPTEYDEFGDPIPGYQTIMPLAAQITSVQKASRVLTDCRFTARLAGAIHMVEIQGNLTYERL